MRGFHVTDTNVLVSKGRREPNANMKLLSCVKHNMGTLPDAFGKTLVGAPDGHVNVILFVSFFLMLLPNTNAISWGICALYII